MTTLKTVSMYLRAAKTDAEDAGEATDGMANSVSELRNQILALTGNKVDIQIDEDTFKSPYQILKELSEVWSEISDISRANILEMVGGKRNANVVAALLENFEVAEKSLAVSADSAGSALTENEKYLDSIDGKIAKLSATFETLSQDVLESELLKVGIDILNFLLKILDFLAKINVLLPGIAASVLLIRGYISAQPLINSVTGLLPQLIAATSATDELKQSVKELNTKEKELLTTIILSKSRTGELSKERAAQILTNYGLAESIDGVGSASKLSSTGIRAMWSAMSGWSKAGAIVSGIFALVGGIYSLVNAIKASKEKIVSDASEAAKALTDTMEQIEEYKAKTQELRKVLDTNASSYSEAYEARKELISIQQTLIDKFGLEAKGINLVTGSIEDQIDAIDRLSKVEYDNWANKHQAAISEMKDVYGQNVNKTVKSKVDLRDILPKDEMLDLRKYISYSDSGITLSTTNLEDAIYGLGEYIKLVRNLPEYVSNEKFAAHVREASNVLADLESQYNKHYETYKTEIPNSLRYEEYYAEEWNRFLEAKTRFEQSLLGGDTKAAAIAEAELQKEYKNIEDLIKSGLWRRDEVVQKYVEDYLKTTQNELSKLVLQVRLSTDFELKQDVRSKIREIEKEYGDATRQLIQDFSTGDIRDVDITYAVRDEIWALHDLAQDANANILDLYDAYVNLDAFVARETSGLEIVSDADKERLDKISEYMSMYESAKNGEALSNLEIADILAENPDLADSIIQVANGYNIETEAIEALIEAEAAQLKMSAELRKENARLNLIETRDGSSGPADWIDSVFSKNSDNISSVDDFKEIVGQQMIPTAELEYISSVIAANKVAMIDEGIKNLSKYLFGDNDSNDKKQKTAFEKAYDEHQHYLAMEQETQEEYLNWLTTAHQEAYNAGQMDLDDYHKYQEEVYEGLKELFDDYLNDAEHRISLLELEEGKSDEIIDTYKKLIGDIETKIAEYRAKGLDENSDYIQELTDKLNEYKENIIEAIESVVEKANEAVDGIKGAYDALTNAAKEYAENGYLSVDSLQEILELSPKYLAMLYNENGQLVINEESIQAVIAARAEELAVETALAYAKSVLNATQNDEIDKLIGLTDVMSGASGATWDLAYATLALAKAEGAAKGWDSRYYDDAYSVIARMQSVAKTAVDSVSAFYKTLDSGYISHKDALQEIMDITQEMIEWEHEQMIEALEQEKDDYAEIIDQKKEMLRLAKEQEDREKGVAEKIAEMAKLQAQIAQLSLDDSREAQAQRRGLEEELAELQKSLADEQSEYSYELQEEALDKELEAFEKEKDEEIELAEDKYEELYGSAEKMHQAVLERITNDWDTLYDQLINWNYEYGSTLQDDLVNAWNAASEAVQRYGSFVDAIAGTNGYTTIGSPYDSAAGADTLESMKANAFAWWTATDAEQKSINNNQLALADQYRALTGENIYRNNGSWFHEDGTSLFSLDKNEIARAIVDKMKQNSAMWMVSDGNLQESLSSQNVVLAERLKNLLGADVHRDSNGVWWIGNKKLYDAYHSGGIVGKNPTLKEKEVMAVLEEGEAVLDEEKEKGLFRVVDFISVLSERLGTALDADNINKIFGGVPSISARTSLADGIGRSMSKIASGLGENYNIERLEVSAPIQVIEKLDDEEIKRHSKTIGNIAAIHIKEGFTKQGIGKSVSLF